MARRQITAELKAILSALPFETRVRGFRSGDAAWVIPDYAFDMTKSEQIASLLRKRGFICEMKGKPGTEGRYIVDVARQEEADGRPPV